MRITLDTTVPEDWYRQNYNRQYYIEHPEYFTTYRDEHKAERTRYNKVWYQENREAKLLRQKEYRSDPAVKVKRREYDKQYRVAHPDANKARRRRYYQKHKEEINANNICRKIGEYVSHKVVAPTGWGRNHLRPVAELNSLDRHELAMDWYSRQFENKWTEEWIAEILKFYENDVDWLIEDAAAYIDDRIPRAYQKHFDENADMSPSQYCIKSRSWTGNLPHGLRYYYRRKYIRNKPIAATHSVAPWEEEVSIHDQLAERVRKKIEAGEL